MVEKGEENESKGMWIIIGICAILLIGFAMILIKNDNPTGATTVKYGNEVITVPQDILETIDLINNLDEKYLTNYHEERLGAYMINNKMVDKYLEDIEKVYPEIKKQNTEASNISLDFLDARKQMLISEKYFQMAIKGGVNSAYNKKTNCDNKQQLLYYTNLYNQSAYEGQQFFKLMDRVLRRSKPAREIIGTDDDKPKFFESPIGNILYLVDVNLYNIALYCEGNLDRNSARFEEYLKHQNITKDEFKKRVGLVS